MKAKVRAIQSLSKEYFAITSVFTLLRLFCFYKDGCYWIWGILNIFFYTSVYGLPFPLSLVETQKMIKLKDECVHSTLKYPHVT